MASPLVRLDRRRHLAALHVHDQKHLLRLRGDQDPLAVGQVQDPVRPVVFLEIDHLLDGLERQVDDGQAMARLPLPVVGHDRRLAVR